MNNDIADQCVFVRVDEGRQFSAASGSAVGVVYGERDVVVAQDINESVAGRPRQIFCAPSTWNKTILVLSFGGPDKCNGEL